MRERDVPLSALRLADRVDLQAIGSREKVVVDQGRGVAVAIELIVVPIGARLDPLATEVAFADEKARDVWAAALRVEAREQSNFVDRKHIDPDAAGAVVIGTDARLSQKRLGAQHALRFLEADSRTVLADVNEQESANDAGPRGRVQQRRTAGDPAPLAGQA